MQLSNTSEIKTDRRNQQKWSQIQFGNTIYNFLNILCAKKWITLLFRENIPLRVRNDLKPTIFSYFHTIPGLLMRQVCGLEKTLINAANVVAQTSLCCTFFPVFSPYVILWHFTFEKPLHPKYFFMIRKNIIYLLTIWQHAAVLVLNLFWYKIQGLVCNDSNDDRGRGSVTIF